MTHRLRAQFSESTFCYRDCRPAGPGAQACRPPAAARAQAGAGPRGGRAYHGVGGREAARARQPDQVVRGTIIMIIMAVPRLLASDSDRH